MTNPPRRYAHVGPEDATPPDYARVARALSDAELEEEIFGGKGEPGYQHALIAEADRRGQAPPPEPITHGGRPLDADEWEQ